MDYCKDCNLFSLHDDGLSPLTEDDKLKIPVNCDKWLCNDNVCPHSLEIDKEVVGFLANSCEILTSILKENKGNG